MLSVLRSQLNARSIQISRPCQHNLLNFITPCTRQQLTRRTLITTREHDRRPQRDKCTTYPDLTRRFGHLAGRSPDKKQEAEKDAQKTAKDLGAETQLSQSEQRRKDWAIIKRLMVNVWPPGDWSVRSRVLLGFGLLVAGKVTTSNGLLRLNHQLNSTGT